MTPLRLIICDDEPLALDRLGDLLARCDDVEVVGSGLNGVEILDMLDSATPDVILLDIEMPRMNGFDVIDAISRRPWPDHSIPPMIIFVTAHPEMAAQAFDSGALDFISKPIRLSRLEQALARARTAVEQMEARSRLDELSSQLEELRRLHAGDRNDQHVWVRTGAEIQRIDVPSIDWIRAEGEYVRFHAGADSYLERGTLAEVAKRFAPFGFVRIHRSFVANQARIVAIERGVWSSMRLRLQSGVHLPVGKKYRAAAIERVRESELS